ncbi:MAG: hypothetical protein JSS10_03355 [Verrucomicrobia bacterium]|nr:hypothetical protein [Verrucomicrobiota bacterium]
MQWKRKKIWPSGGLILLASLTPLHADGVARNKNGQETLQPEVSVFSPHVSGEALFWSARQDGLSYVVTTEAPASDFTNIPGFGPLGNQNADYFPAKHAKDKAMNFGWDWGFRVGIGGIFQRQGNWDLNLVWTHYRQRNHASAHQSAKNILLPIWINPLVGFETATDAKAHWHLHYDTLDLEFGPCLHVTKWFSFRPHIDLRAARINQDFKVEYENINGFARLPAVFGELDNKLKNDFQGIGLRLGFDTKWYFAEHWNVYGNFAAAFLYGVFHVGIEGDTEGFDLDQWTTQNGFFPVVTPDLDYADRFHTTKTNIDLALGFSWEYPFSQNRRFFSLNVGYEYHIWFNQNQLERLVEGQTSSGQFTKDHGDLGLSGLVLGAKCRF